MQEENTVHARAVLFIKKMEIKSEQDLIDIIRELIERKGPPAPPGLLRSIGDDCAVFMPEPGVPALVTTDISIESVHFRRDYASAEDIGYKAMIGNVSDIVAMGGSARYAVISCGLTDDLTSGYVRRVYEGMIEAASGAGAHIIGGDLSRSSVLVISVAMYGVAHPSGAVLRSGAAVGDRIFCTGITGDSLAGLEVLNGHDRSLREKYASLVKAHLRPNCRHDIVTEIVQHFSPSAMIDVSDGLLIDLGRICRESGCGFRLFREKIRVSSGLREYCAEKGRDPVEYALRSGEEYQLIFTTSKDLGETMQMNINGVPLTCIGEIIESGHLMNISGSDRPVEIQGYDHFAGAGE